MRLQGQHKPHYTHDYTATIGTNGGTNHISPRFKVKEHKVLEHTREQGAPTKTDVSYFLIGI